MQLRIRSCLVAALLATVCVPALPAVAQNATCNAPALDTVSIVELSGSPFSAIPTPDGCTIFVSLSGQAGHIGVFHRANGRVTLAHDVRITSAPAGMAMSHDGKLLVAAAGANVLVFDVARLSTGDETPLTSAADGARAGSVYAAITFDDRLLFVSDEGTATVSVYDLAKMRAGITERIGGIPVGVAPVGLVQSPDGRTLYATSERAPMNVAAPATCNAEGGRGGRTAQGIVSVIDVSRAASDPAHAVVATVPGGCDPVRIALSPSRRQGVRHGPRRKQPVGL